MKNELTHIGEISLSSLKQNYIRIENLAQYKVNVKTINPLHELEYINYWRSIKKKVVEGMWGKESNGYRYCSGSLFFYCNFALIQDTDENKNTTFIKPLIRDLEWEIFYMMLEAEGFSGFVEDDVYTSDKLILSYDVNRLPKNYREFQLFNKDGKFKQYRSAREAVRSLYKTPLGPPLYFNQAQNVSILGSRGGGKSYIIALGKLLHALIIDGGRYYNSDNGKFYKLPGFKDEDLLDDMNKPLAEVMVGSGDTNKSSEFVSKIRANMEALATEKEFGVWGSPEDDDYMPCGLFKEMSGSLLPGNKKNPWRNEYKISSKGRELSEGSSSKLFHVSYSAQKAKGKGSQEGAGGRTLYSVTEESGLCFGKNTEIRMHDGSVKYVQDIIDGDILMGDDGTPRTVYGSISGIDDLYQVSQTFGDDYIVNAEHPVCVKHKRWYKGKTMIKEKEIWASKFNDTKDKKTHYGYKNKELFFKEKDLKLDPYYYGYWLGDGSRNSADITTCDKEVINYLTQLAKSKGLKTKIDKLKNNKADIYRFCRDNKDSGGKTNYFRQGLKYYNSFTTKFLHLDFIHNSKDVRLQLLAGLIDSDGCLIETKTSNYYEFYQTNRLDLIEKVEYLCTSLGFKVSRRVKITNKGYDNEILSEYRNKYTLRISGNVDQIPTKIKYKQTKKREYLKDFLNTSIKINKIGPGNYYGFTLKESPYFLLKDGTVVRNTDNSVEIHNSNTSVVSRNGIQFGVQIDIGTSGNIEAIVQTKKKFLNPQDYSIVSFPDEWEGMGKGGQIGFFLPFYMTLNQFKDINGNTDFVAAFNYVNTIRMKASESDDPSVLREEKMNRPIIPSEMWTTNKGYYLPYDQAIQTEKYLLMDNKYVTKANHVKLYFDSKYPKGVRYEIDHEADPFYEWPVNTNRTSMDGTITIYHWPEDNHPKDKYFFTHDPYVSENINDGGSLGVTHGWINPKYWDELPETGPLVCTFISKPLGGLRQYYEEQEKILQFYGNPLQGLAYEANKGTDCKNYYQRKGKVNLLALRPYFDNNGMYMKKITEYGYIVGNRLSKIKYLDSSYDFLMTPIFINGVEKLVIDTLHCIFTVRQIVGYDIDGNFDAVSSMIIAPKHIENIEQLGVYERESKRNRLVFFSDNKRVFKQEYKIPKTTTTTTNNENIWNLTDEIH